MINPNAEGNNVVNMRRKSILFCLGLAVFVPQLLFGQETLLKIIEPEITSAPILDATEFNKEMTKISQLIDDYGNDYINHLTARQKQLIDYHLYDVRDNPWDVSQIGDGWYNSSWPEFITTSSDLTPAGSITYKAANAHDFSLRTAWVAGGAGIEESITYRFRKEEGGSYITLNKIIIYNGYQKSYKTWCENSRVKQFKLYINDKPYAMLNLEDTIAGQNFTITAHKLSGLRLKFEITKVYCGEVYNDVAVSEIEFDGEGHLCFAAGTMIAIPGGAKPIEQITLGDTILSLKTSTGKVEPTTVLEIANRQHTLYELNFGELRIKTTVDHPFYHDGRYYSVEANFTYGVQTNRLAIGQKITCLYDGRLETATLQKIHKLVGAEQTYTITKLSRNNLFFADGLCVAIEKIK